MYTSLRGACRHFYMIMKFDYDLALSVFLGFRHRIWKDEWWLKLRPLLRILAKHESIYEVQSSVADAVFDDENGKSDIKV